MSMPSDDEGKTEAFSESEASSDTPESEEVDGWSVVSLIPFNGVEPPKNVTDDEAEAIWSTVSAPWHPAILATLTRLPRIESEESPGTPGPRELRVIVSGRREHLPSGYQTQAEDAGSVLVDGTRERQALVSTLITTVTTSGVESAEATALALDFLALGTSYWWLRDLTTAMGHVDTLDQDALTYEVRSGARAWVAEDLNTAKNHLRAAFEQLTQARERFYPVDSYLVDICLIDPAMPKGVLADPLDARTPVTFLAPAKAIEAQAERDPENLQRLREAIGEGWADVAGGAYAETEEPLLPIESIFWQLKHGGEVYREHLDQRNVETLARRRFGLYPLLPQIGKRFGFRFAVHLGFDAGRFPVRPEAKRLWESPDHTNLETLTRPPLAADRPLQGLMLPWRLAASMKDDHVSTLPLLHWPGQVASWFRDLRRVVGYSSVMARWVTLNDFFHLTDRPYEVFGPEPDEYVTPYLSQAVAKRDLTPISAKAVHARLRSRLDALSVLEAMAEGVGTAPTAEVSVKSQAELAVETGKHDTASTLIETSERVWTEAVARGVGGASANGRPGFLVINPAGITRRVAVNLPEAALDLRPEGPLRAAQLTDEGVVAVVEVPAFGFAWVPRDTNFEASPAPSGTVSVREKVLKNEALSVEIDSATGGIRGIKGIDEDTSRLGQQLVIAGLSGPSKMRGTAFEVEYAGPALVQAVSAGTLLGPDDRRLATFRQRFRLWSGRPVLEIDVTLSDLDSTWLASLADADPWSNYLACRWAWPDPNSMLRRTCLLAPELTEAERPETPDAIDISTRRQRTALLFGGLAHHRRHGTRMLDTLLLAGRESCRNFQLGVTLDLEHLFHATTDMISPAFVVPTEAGPPKNGPTGWLFQTDHKGIAVTRVEYLAATDDGRGWGLAFHMLETTGKPSRCRLRTFRNPSWARQTDFLNEVIVDLPVDGDAALVDFTPYELARVEVTLG